MISSLASAEQAIIDAQNQLGDVDVFFDNLDEQGFPPGTNLPLRRLRCANAWDPSVDRGSDPAIVRDYLNECKALVEDDSTRIPRAEMFRAKYSQRERGWASYLREQLSSRPTTIKDDAYPLR